MKKKWEKHSGELCDKKNGYDVINCCLCGFRHIIPIPDNKEINQYYTAEFYSTDKPYYFDRHEKSLKWWNMVYEERYVRFEKYLGKGRRSILDIGSGPGFFLKLGKDRGWETLGIEPSRNAAKYAQSMGLDVINNFLNEAIVDKLGRFDVIHMQSVMEHLQDPGSVIDICYRILKPGGLFCAVVANDYNPLQMILREEFGYEPWWLVPPQHINYFNVESLKRFIKSFGFEIKHVVSTFPMEMFLLMGDNYIGNDKLGKECHARRTRLEFALTKGSIKSLKSDLYEGFAKCGIGRSIDLTVIKPIS